MAVWIIVSGLVAVCLTGLMVYIASPILYQLYSNEDVQNMTGPAKIAADANYQIASVMGMLMVGAVFINMYARSIRRSSGSFLE